MALNDTSKNLMLEALATVAVFVSAHTADPGTTGTNELTVGPTYVRMAIAWNAASGGALDSNGTSVIPCDAADVVAWLGLWSAESAGTFYGSADVTDETFTAAGTYTVTDFDISIT